VIPVIDDVQRLAAREMLRTIACNVCSYNRIVGTSNNSNTSRI